MKNLVRRVSFVNPAHSPLLMMKCPRCWLPDKLHQFTILAETCLLTACQAKVGPGGYRRGKFISSPGFCLNKLYRALPQLCQSNHAPEPLPYTYMNQT